MKSENKNAVSHPWNVQGRRRFKEHGDTTRAPYAAPPPPESVDSREFDGIVRSLPSMYEHNVRRFDE